MKNFCALMCSICVGSAIQMLALGIWEMDTLPWPISFCLSLVLFLIALSLFAFSGALIPRIASCGGRAFPFFCVGLFFLALAVSDMTYRMFFGFGHIEILAGAAPQLRRILHAGWPSENLGMDIIFACFALAGLFFYTLGFLYSLRKSCARKNAP